MDGNSLGFFGTTAASSLVTVYVLNWLENLKSVPWVSAQNKRMTHVLSIIASVGTGLGIHFHFQDGTLAITGLTLATIIPALWHCIQQYVVTKTSYTMLKGKLNEAAPAPKP